MLSWYEIVITKWDNQGKNIIIIYFMVKLKFLRIFINVTIENKILYNLDDMIIYLFFWKEIPFFLNKRRRESKNSDNQVKDPSKSQTFHSKYSGKGKKYADLKGNISIKCLNKLF